MFGSSRSVTQLFSQAEQGWDSPVTCRPLRESRHPTKAAFDMLFEVFSMAERNPAPPRTNHATNQINQVVAWPETAPETVVREEIFNESGAIPTERARQTVETGAGATQVSSLINNIRRLADERPSHVLSAVAGVAFVAGVALRIWRSRYE